MGILDDWFDTKIVDKDKARLKYTPPSMSQFKLPPVKHNTKNEIQKVKQDKYKQSEERHSKLIECGKWIYMNSVEWLSLIHI